MTTRLCFSANKEEAVDNELEKGAEKELLEREDAEMVGRAAFCLSLKVLEGLLDANRPSCCVCRRSRKTVIMRKEKRRRKKKKRWMWRRVQRIQTPSQMKKVWMNVCRSPAVAGVFPQGELFVH